MNLQLINSIASDVPRKERWKVLSHVIGRLVDRHVIIRKHAKIRLDPPLQKPVQRNQCK